MGLKKLILETKDAPHVENHVIKVLLLGFGQAETPAISLALTKLLELLLVEVSDLRRHGMIRHCSLLDIQEVVLKPFS